jgi:periplasmic divalent cation tolerance protein
MAEYIQVITTTNTEEEARKIQRVLVEERTAACVQIIGPISSLYWWEGKIEEAEEWICLAKAKSEDYQRIESLIRENHSYSLPEILAMPVSAGNKDYLAWISEVTSV